MMTVFRQWVTATSLRSLRYNEVDSSIVWPMACRVSAVPPSPLKFKCGPTPLMVWSAGV